MDGLMQERRNSITNALELCLSCTNPSIYRQKHWVILTRYFLGDMAVISNVTFKHILMIDILSIKVNISRKLMSEDLSDGKSSLVQVKPLPEPMFT